MKPAKVTRNGVPAYLNAPPRLTQRAVDLDRAMQARAKQGFGDDLRQLGRDAREVGEPWLGKGAVIVCMAVLAWLFVFGACFLMVPK